MEPVLSSHGYAIKRMTYDSAGNTIKETYSDTADRYVLLKDGYAGIRFKYDAI